MLAKPRNRFPLHSILLALAAAAVLAGCGPEAEFGSGPAALNDYNGMSANGMSANGMSVNGMSANGMSANGLSTPAFGTWFNGNAALSDEVMKYTAACGVAAGSKLTWTNPQTGATHSWAGRLGFAPYWINGPLWNPVEAEVMSACLAMHVNKFGLGVNISVRGWDVLGKPIDTVLGEFGSYSQQEGAFFGNIFDGSGVFSCYSRKKTKPNTTSVRACAFSMSGPGTCAPIVSAGACEDICRWKTAVNLLGQSMAAWADCTVGGHKYRPLTSFIRASDLFTCGDGVCQISEQGGVCPADCP